MIATTDGRVLTGIIRAEDKDTITLVTANETITLPKSEVDERKASEQSMMPEDLWKAALRARDPLAGRLSRQPGAGAIAGGGRRAEGALIPDARARPDANGR